MKTPSHLLWLDIETIGTDENRDPIIEIAVKLTRADIGLIDCVTGPDYRPIEFSTPIGPEIAPARLDSLPKQVRDMHTRNGLFDALRGAPSVREAESAVVDLISKHFHPKHRIPVAGSGVAHFDRRFIAAQMPRLDRRLAYAPYDLGSVRRFRELAGLKRDGSFDPKTHRAADCVALHLAEARDYLARLTA